MSARTEAYARYLKEIYKEYDARVDNERLISEIHLSTVEVQLEQIISLSENFDIEDLILLVLIEASKDAQEDLRNLLEDMRAATQTKRRLRDTIAKLKKRIEAEEHPERDEYRQHEDHEREFEPLDIDLVTQTLVVVAAQQSNREVQAFADELTLTRLRLHRDDATDKAKNDLDSMSELAEMESLRLQMAMDRRSKFMEALSNIMKKMSDTDSAIVQNLK